MLLDAGESIKAVSEYLGHADAGFTLRTYTHLMPSSAERTMRAVDDAFACYMAATSTPEVEAVSGVNYTSTTTSRVSNAAALRKPVHDSPSSADPPSSRRLAPTVPLIGMRAAPDRREDRHGRTQTGVLLGPREALP